MITFRRKNKEQRTKKGFISFLFFLSSFFLFLIGLASPQEVSATACPTYSAQPCPVTPGMQEVTDGPTITACPGSKFAFKGCSNAPKTGTGIVLCCDDESKTGEAETCGPNSVLDPNNTYKCVSSATECTGLKGNVFIPIQGQNNCSLDLVKGYGFRPCCKIPGPQTIGGTSATAKKVAPTSYSLSNPLGTTSIPVIIGKIIKTFLGIVGALALLVFVYGGVAWMTARGDAGQVKHAQQALQGAILGLIIVSGSYLFADSFIKALTEMQVTNTAGTGSGTGGTEATQATTEQTTLEQQQAEAAAAAKAKAGGTGAVCVGDASYAKACQGDCKQFCLNQAKDEDATPADHPCTNLGQNGCPTDQLCCSWKK